eukprot:GHRR01033124.1.p1 GENE.GHRR01033124.1~~GHRR01033124.1.p1  ORF type:complete len:108 (+),score=17.20 GHRR01033124.1:245-568(+)
MFSNNSTTNCLHAVQACLCLVIVAVPACVLFHHRQELYPMPYSSINWDAARNQIAKEDLYYPHPIIQDILWWTLYKAEALLLGSSLRKAALNEVRTGTLCWFTGPNS